MEDLYCTCNRILSEKYEVIGLKLAALYWNGFKNIFTARGYASGLKLSSLIALMSVSVYIAFYISR